MTVVVGVDTSKTAARAAETAARLADGLGTDLVVVCAASDKNHHGPSVPDRKMTSPDRAVEVANEIIEQLREAHPDLTMTPDSEDGKPAEVLVEAATKHDADIIVVGNRNAQGVSRLLGSIAIDVVRHAPCDVYVAHTR